MKLEKMINPWNEFVKDFDNTNLIINSEQEIIEDFNNNSQEKFQIHNEIMPAPFMGDVHNSPIVILMLNPGYDPKEDTKGFYEKYSHFWKKEIQHISPIAKLPLSCLDENYCNYSPYWRSKLDPIISISSIEKVSKNISSIQLFPYHSKKYKAIPKRMLKKHGFEKFLPSQEYNFQLVREAISRNALIIIPRAVKNWLEAVEELKDYKNKYSTNSYLNIIMSENNLGTGFNEVRKILET